MNVIEMNPVDQKTERICTRKGGTMKRIAASGIGLWLSISFLGLAAYAQNPATAPASQSGDSLADYARSIRKDSGAKTKPRVFDNDNLPVNDKLSIVGPAESTAENSAAAKPEEAQTTVTETKSEAKGEGQSETKAAAGSAESKPADEKTAAPGASKPEDDAAKAAASKQWEEKLTTQKDQIDLLGRELNVLQREYQIRAAAMYGDAGSRLRNSGEWDKQDAQYKQQIADKQKALDDAKQKLDDLQEEARKAGVPASIREQ
jgi:hypothetical protein